MKRSNIWWSATLVVIGCLCGFELLRLHRGVSEFYPETFRASHLAVPYFSLRCYLWPFGIAVIGGVCLASAVATDAAAWIRPVLLGTLTLAVVLMLVTVSGYVIAFMPMTPYRGEMPRQSAEPSAGGNAR